MRELAASITFIYLNLTVIHVFIWNRGIYLIFPRDVFRGKTDLNLHQPYPFMLAGQTFPGCASPGHAPPTDT